MAPYLADYSLVYAELGIFYILFFLTVSAVCQEHLEELISLILLVLD